MLHYPIPSSFLLAVARKQTQALSEDAVWISRSWLQSFVDWTLHWVISKTAHILAVSLQKLKTLSVTDRTWPEQLHQDWQRVKKISCHPGCPSKATEDYPDLWTCGEEQQHCPSRVLPGLSARGKCPSCHRACVCPFGSLPQWKKLHSRISLSVSVLQEIYLALQLTYICIALAISLRNSTWVTRANWTYISHRYSRYINLTIKLNLVYLAWQLNCAHLKCHL